MAFDIATAKPVEEDGGQQRRSRFDISTAKPISNNAEGHPAEDEDDNRYSSEEYEAPKESTVKRIGKLVDAGKKEDRAPIVPIAEAGANMVSGLASSAAGGLRGLYSLASGDGLDEASRKIQETQQKFTYEPRTAAGKALTLAAGLPMEAATDAAKYAGGKVGGAIAGEKGRIAGEAIGEVAPSVIATLQGGYGGLKAARAAGARPVEPIPGKDFSPLRDLTPEQKERLVRQKNLGMKPTLGSVTRDPEQFRFEEQTAKTGAGERLRQVELENNQALIRAVEDTDRMRAGRTFAENEREAGKAVADALLGKFETSKARVRELYKQAEQSGETKAVVDTKPLERYLKGKEAEMIAVPEIKAIASKLDALKRAAKGKITVDDLENLYQSANDLSKPGEASSKFMGDIKSKINQITEGAGGDMYREARKARLAHALEFEDRAGIARLIERKPGSRTDFKTPTEDVFRRTVVNSSVDELKDVTNSLLSTDPKKSPNAWQAVREMQGQTIDYLIEQATKAIAEDERGNPSFSPAGFRRGVHSIGREKLDWLLGPEAVNRLYDILKSAKEAKTAPGRVSGSDTYLNLKAEAAKAARDAAVKHLASHSSVGGAVFGYFQKRSAAKMLQDQIDEALTPSREPLSEIRAQAREVNRQRLQHTMADALGGTKQMIPVGMATLTSTRKLDKTDSDLIRR